GAPEAQADGLVEDLQKRIDKFSDELDEMADHYNPITYTSPAGVVFEFPNPIDYVIGSGQGAKSDLWKDRENSIYNTAIRADPAGAFKKQVDKASDIWKQMSASIEPKLETTKPKIQDVRSAVLLRKTPLLETMTTAAGILQGDGQEAFDRESLTQQQDALDQALSKVVGYAEARQVDGVRQSYYEAKDIFTSWTVSRVGR
ncbi:PAB8, partial [Symbiodinium pilosum]